MLLPGEEDYIPLSVTYNARLNDVSEIGQYLIEDKAREVKAAVTKLKKSDKWQINFNPLKFDEFRMTLIMTFVVVSPDG